MPQRSSISLLPQEVREEFERRLIAGGFRDYEGLAAWLREKGFEISRSAAQRYGQKFEANLAAIKIATEQARAITEAVGDDQGMLGDALTRLAQQKAFDVLVNMETEAADVYLPHLGRMVAELNKSSIAQKKWMAEARNRAQKAADQVEEKVKKFNLTPEELKTIREEIYGVVG